MSNSPAQTFTARVRRFIEAGQLLRPGARYIVGLSGGADSVALLLTLKRLGYKVEAATCNFHLRGAESDRDETFCEQLCRREHIAFHRVHFDTLAYASLHKVSIEMAARDLRYAYFEQLRRDLGAEAVCVAHHEDDCVETVLLNLVRGTGLHGLRGILPRSGNIVRPLLCVSRKDIEAFLAAIGQDYVTDSSNLVADVQRNKLRLEVLPLLETLNPAVRQNIARTALNLQEAALVCDESLARSAEAVCPSDAQDTIDIAALLAQPSPESTLYYIVSRRGFSPTQTREMLHSLETGSGRLWTSPTHELTVDRGRLLMQEKSAPARRPMHIPETGTYVYDSTHRFSFTTEPVGEGYEPSRTADCVCLDASLVAWPLTLRSVAEGDRFIPFGMKGQKLVSDFLTDAKCSLFDKRRQLVVCDATGRILWLVGRRADNRFRISPTTTVALRILLRV